MPQVVRILGVTGWTIGALALIGRWPVLLPLGLAGVGAAYALFLSLRGDAVDPRAPFVAAAIFAAAELGFWSVEVRAARAERAVVTRRLVLLGAGAFAAAILGSLLLVAAAGTSGGVALEAIGVLAAVVAIAIVAFLTARSRDSTST